MRQIVKELLGIDIEPEKIGIRYQEYQRLRGATIPVSIAYCIGL